MRDRIPTLDNAGAGLRARTWPAGIARVAKRRSNPSARWRQRPATFHQPRKSNTMKNEYSGSLGAWWQRTCRWLATGLVALSIAGCATTAGVDPLPSWADGPARKAIVSF